MKIVKFFILLMVVGCSPQTRLNRLVDKHPYLFKNRIDTVVDTVTIVTPTIKKDTVFSYKVGDTVVITKDKLTVKYVKLPGDSVYIEGACKGDTITKIVKIPCPQLVVEQSYWGRKLGKVSRVVTVLSIISAIVLLVLLGLRYVFRR